MMLDEPALRIRARYLVVDPWTVIEDGWIALTADGVVRALGPVKPDVAGYFDQEVAGVVAAAMVNAHCHAEFGAQHGVVPGGYGLPEWVDGLLSSARSAGPERRLEGMHWSAHKLVETGCGWIADINNYNDSAPVLAAAGLRGIVFHELLDPRPECVPELVEQARATATAGRDPALLHRIAPHAPQTCSAELLRALLRDAAADAPVSLHLAEDPAEFEFLMHGTGPWVEFLRTIGGPSREYSVPGMRPIPWLDELGLLGPGLLAVHLTQADPAEAALLARRQVKTVVCPASNRHILDRLPPLPELLAAGLRPGLGTDSAASHPDLDLRSDLCVLAEAFPQLAPATLWALATRWGAAALALEGVAGSLWPGRAPGLIAIDCDPGEDPLRVLTTERARPPRRLADPGPASEDASY